MRFAEFSFLLPFRLLTFSCRKKEIVYEKEVFVHYYSMGRGGVIFLLALLTSCPGSSDIKIHTVTFDLGYDGAPPPEKVEIEDGAVLPSVEDPVRYGYQFDDWYTADGMLYDFKTPVTESFTLTAHWIQNSGGGGGGSSAPTEEDLTGQWAFYYLESSDNFYLIDIQHTLQGYWIAMHREGENLENAVLPVKSDRTEENGWFVVDSLFGSGTVMKYKLVDDEPNTLEGEILYEGETVGKGRLKRIPSDQETKLHIVTFISPDDGYVFYATDIPEVSSPLLIAVKHGESLGEYFPNLKQNGTDVTAQFKFTTADGKGFSADTTVNSDIIVTVTLKE